MPYTIECSVAVLWNFCKSVIYRFCFSFFKFLFVYSMVLVSNNITTFCQNNVYPYQEKNLLISSTDIREIFCSILTERDSCLQSFFRAVISKLWTYRIYAAQKDYVIKINTTTNSKFHQDFYLIMSILYTMLP